MRSDFQSNTFRRSRLILLPLFTLMVLIAVVLAPMPRFVVRAHGGGLPRVINQPSGPYTLSVWTDPNPLLTNDAHIEVAVLEPSTLEPLVTDVRVMVELQSDARPGEVFRQEATTAQSAIKTLYVAVYSDLPVDGRWRVKVLVEGGAGVADPVSFDVDIAPPPPFDWLRYGIGAAAVVGGALVVVLWARRQPQAARPRRRSQSR